jgi:hypothetical protein
MPGRNTDNNIGKIILYCIVTFARRLKVSMSRSIVLVNEDITNNRALAYVPILEVNAKPISFDETIQFTSFSVNCKDNRYRIVTNRIGRVICRIVKWSMI